METNTVPEVFLTAAVADGTVPVLILGCSRPLCVRPDALFMSSLLSSSWGEGGRAGETAVMSLLAVVVSQIVEVEEEVAILKLEERVEERVEEVVEKVVEEVVSGGKVGAVADEERMRIEDWSETTTV